MYRFEYKAYRRPFAGAFQTARERFSKREGLLVRLEDRDGRTGFGEVAPIASFGSESFPFAVAAAEALGDKLESESVVETLDATPALRWAIETAMDAIGREGRWPEIEEPWPVCGLVAELADIAEIQGRLNHFYRCLKFKIGKRPFLEERRDLEKVVEMSEGAVKIRLDANASLDARATKEWLESVTELPIEFLEQPMEKGAEREMMRLCRDYPTSVALDESVASVDDLKRWRDEQWPGVFVVKPSLSGGLRALRAELENGVCDCVFSSALETKVGTANAIGFALRFPAGRRALGFGVEGLFGDRNVGLEIGPFLQNGSLPDTDELETLWSRI